jgi:Zn-dependent protease with chaperone function
MGWRASLGSLPYLMVVVAEVILFSAPAWGAGHERADLYLNLDARGAAAVTLVLDFEPAASAPFEQGLREVLGGRLQGVEHETDENRWLMTAQCDRACLRRDMCLTGMVDPAPLVKRLRPLGVRWLTVNLTHPAVGFTHCFGAAPVAAERRSEAQYFQPYLVTEFAPPIFLTFGYSSVQLLRVMLLLLSLLLLPVGLTLWKRRTALRATDADPTAVWFSYSKFLGWVGLGGLPVWIAAVFLLHADAVAGFALGTGRHGMGMDGLFVLVVLPPVLISMLCNLLSQPVFARVRGSEWTRGELARQSGWKLAAGLLPLLFLLAGANQFLENEPRRGVIYFAAAIVTRILCALQGQKVLGMGLSALTFGELRDRIFALGEKAGVKIQQIYVLPSGKGRMANAFAMQGNNVLLTDYLLEHLSKREVDAIAAHELAHLRRRDPRRLWLVIILVCALAGGVSAGLDSLKLVSANGSPFVMAGAVLLAIMLFYFFSRRFERAADAGAVTLTGDPEALITALAQVMRLNLLPMHWGKWDERMLTHPSTLRRVQAIAAQGGVSAERLQELLSSPGTDVERYSLPSTTAAEGRVFSTTVRGSALVRNSWTLMGVMVLTPALFASVVHQYAMPVWIAWLGGLLATLALYLVVLDYVPLWGYRDLQRRLAAKLEREGTSPEPSGGVFVGFAPAASPRLYEGFYDWDIGFLFLQGDRLCFAGDQTRFALRRDQVMEIALGPGGPGWWGGPRVYVTWRDEETGRGGTFNLRPGDARSMRQLRRETRACEKQLRSWWAQPPATVLALPLRDLSLPGGETVTSASPGDLLNERTFLRTLLFVAVLAAGASVLFGLPLNVMEPGSAVSAIVIACATAIFQWVPYFRYREPAVPGSNSNKVD